MKEVKNCKNCGSPNVGVEEFVDVNMDSIFYVICQNCKESTPNCKTKEDAIREWNDRN